MNKKNIFLILTLIFVLSINLVNAQNNPVIRMSISSYDPMPVEPGQTIDVWITVQNTGLQDAKDIEIKFKESNIFSLINPAEEIKNIPVLGTYKDYSLKYTFRVADNAPEGINTLNFEYTVGNNYGVIHNTLLSVQVKSNDLPISVSSLNINPNPLQPGQVSVVTLSLKNLASSAIMRNVNIELRTFVTGQNMQPIDLPFAVIDSVGQKSINRILPGQTTEFAFNVMAYPDADSGIYKLPVIITYYDDIGRSYERASFISLKINSEPELMINLENSNLNSKVKNGEVMFDVINNGVSGVKLMTFTLLESDDYEVLSSSDKAYLGNVDSDDFKTARFRVNALNNDVTFKIKLDYLDLLNNEFSETYEVKHTLKDPVSNGNNNFTIIIVILLVLGGVIYFWRKRKKSRINKEE